MGNCCSTPSQATVQLKKIFAAESLTQVKNFFKLAAVCPPSQLLAKPGYISGLVYLKCQPDEQ